MIEITFNHNRDQSLQALADAYVGKIGNSIDEIRHGLSDWEVIGLMIGDDLIGAVCVKDHEGHIGIKKEFRGKWNGMKELNKLCKIFSVNRTIVSHGNEKSMSFLEHCGWNKTGENFAGVVYVLK